MKLLETEKYTAQLLGDQVFIYFDEYSDVIFIENIENSQNPQEDIDRELELMARNSRTISALLD